jgi:hypothetical protein
MTKTITKLIAILMAIALYACLFVGCSGSPEVSENASKLSSFVIVEDGAGYYIVYHKDTKVMYTFSTGGSNLGTFCLLVNADGTPMIWEGE